MLPIGESPSNQITVPRMNPTPGKVSRGFTSRVGNSTSFILSLLLVGGKRDMLQLARLLSRTKPFLAGRVHRPAQRRALS